MKIKLEIPATHPAVGLILAMQSPVKADPRLCQELYRMVLGLPYVPVWNARR